MRGTAVAMFAIGLLLVRIPGAAGSAAQTFDLEPGWNSVFLEVQPENPAPAEVFADLPVEMVWTFFPASGSTEFIADPDEDLWNLPGWHVFIPEGREDSVLTNLHAIPGGRAYLLRIESDEPATWEVEGVPVHRPPEWEPDAYTLAGLPVNPGQTVNFGAFFSPSPAHHNQPFYRLTPEGEWVRAHNSAVIERGEAYWIFTDRASSYAAPLEVELETGRSLDFGESATERLVHLENHTDWPVTVTFAHSGTFPLLRGFANEHGTTQWEDLDGFTLSLEPGERRSIRTGLDRSAIAGEAGGVLEIAAGDILHRIPVEAEELTGAGPLAFPAEESNGAVFGGLWVGTVTVDAVNDVNDPEDTTIPRPAPATFSKRIIVHVDASGASRLLKEAILLWQDGEAGESTETPDVPGRYVLISDHDLIPHYRGAALRDGRPFGYRVSAATFDFEGDSLDMSGTFGSELSAAIPLARDHATNPFRHRFHPGHNHLDLDGNPLDDVSVGREEVWSVDREIFLHFDKPASGSPLDGHSRLRGEYRETLTNLHRNPIYLRGEFELRRINPIRELNPEP